jgi:hypothetical protein
LKYPQVRTLICPIPLVKHYFWRYDSGMAKQDKQQQRKEANRSNAAPQAQDNQPEDGGGAGPEVATGKEQPAAFVPRGEAVSGGSRASFGLKEDGTIDWDSLKGKNRDKVVAALRNDPQVAKLSGRDTPAGEVFQFQPSDARAALNMLTEANQFAVSFVFKKKGLPIDGDILAQSFTFPVETEKELCDRGAKLLNRYSSDWMRKHADLVIFFAVYIDCVKTQAITAATLQFQRNAHKQQRATAVEPNGHAKVQPISEAEKIYPADLSR